MSTDAIRSMLQLITGNTEDSIKNALQVLSARIPDADTAAQDALNVIAETFNDTTLNRVDNVVYCYEYVLDRQLNPLLQKLENQINDRVSALKAIDQCDMAWFRNIPMSLNAKQSIASKLIALTSTYTQSYNNLWRSIVDGNSDVLLKIVFYTDVNNDNGEG